MSKSKVILFGGATGDTGKYIITGDTYALDLICNKWAKLDGKSICLISNTNQSVQITIALEVVVVAAISNHEMSATQNI